MQKINKKHVVLVQLECPVCQRPVPLFPCDGETIYEMWESMGESFTMRCPACSGRLYVARTGQAATLSGDNAKNKSEQALQIKKIS